MILNLLGSGMSAGEIFIELLLLIPTLLLSFSLHECAHAYAADRMGDHTAKNFGRLTLNPLKHLDPIGTIGMLLLGIGWAKPVPINARYFKNPKKGMALSALAGPLSNLILALIAVVGYQITNRLSLKTDLGGIYSLNFSAFKDMGAPFTLLMAMVAMSLFSLMAWMNISLCIFNLIPIPPFDGSRIAFALLPDKIYWGMMKYERYIMIGLLVLLFLGNRIGFSPISGITGAVLNLFYKLTNWIVVL